MFFSKYPYTDFHEMNLDWVLEKIGELEKRIKPTPVSDTSMYIDVTTQGVVMNDLSKAESNTSIINDLLNDSNVLFVPEGTVFTSAPLIVKNRSGIVGLGVKSVIKTTGDYNAINIPVSVNDSEGVYTSVTLKDLSIIGTYGLLSANTHAGLFFYNYTFTDTCGRNAELYTSRYHYALEYRNSIFSGLYIGSFKYGVYTDNFTALIHVKDSMLVHNETSGMMIHSSDSIFESMYITYNRNGIVTDSESNQFSNIKVYMNGVVENGTQADIDASSGISMYGATCRNNMFSNVQLQENYGNGLVISDYANCIALNSVIVDANGFRSENSNTGLTLYNNVHDITGSIIACDKNETPTQRLGAYFTDNCYNINLLYEEHNNIQNIDTAGWHTYNSLHISRDKWSGALTYNTSVLSSNDNAYACYDGDILSVSLIATATTNISAGTMIADLTEVYNILPSYGKRFNTAFNFPVMGIAAGLYFADGKIYAGGTISQGETLHINTCYRPVYFNG